MARNNTINRQDKNDRIFTASNKLIDSFGEIEELAAEGVISNEQLMEIRKHFAACTNALNSCIEVSGEWWD